MTRGIVIKHDSGTIMSVALHDVQNADSYAEDGYVIHEDGRLLTSDYTQLVITGEDNATIADLITWWDTKKYGIVADDLDLDVEWLEPAAPIVPEEYDPEIPEAEELVE